MNKISLSIIVVSYNTQKITEECLKSIINSLLNTKMEYEIIVVDNASTDGTRETLELIKNLKLKIKNYNSKFKIILNNKNVGFARANNQAVECAKGNCLLFLNSDIIVLDDAIEKLVGFFMQNENQIHFLGGKLLNKDYSSQASCGPFYSLPVVFGALFLRGDYWGLTRYSPEKIKEVDWISGACILTKKEYFKKIGGFDEGIFMYMDEVDLLYRAKKAGFKVFFYPQAKFIHLGSASSGGKTYPIIQVFSGLLYFYRKHYNNAISIFLLKFMLQLKSLSALTLGKLTKNSYLINTYAQALKVAKLG